MPNSANIEETAWPTIREAARRAGLGERPLRSAIRRGELSLHIVPDAWPRLHWPDVEAWLRSHRVERTSHARARVAEIEGRGARG